MWSAAGWILLYWLAAGALIFFANHVRTKYPAYRKQAGVVLGVAIVLVPIAPLILLAAWFIAR